MTYIKVTLHKLIKMLIFENVHFYKQMYDGIVYPALTCTILVHANTYLKRKLNVFCIKYACLSVCLSVYLSIQKL